MSVYLPQNLKIQSKTKTRGWQSAHEMVAAFLSIKGDGILNSVVWVSRQLMEEKRLRV